MSFIYGELSFQRLFLEYLIQPQRTEITCPNHDGLAILKIGEHLLEEEVMSRRRQDNVEQIDILNGFCHISSD